MQDSTKSYTNCKYHKNEGKDMQLNKSPEREISMIDLNKTRQQETIYYI